MGGLKKDDPVHGDDGGGAEQMIIKYRLCRRYNWTQKPGYSNIDSFPFKWGLSPPPLAPNKIITADLI